MGHCLRSGRERQINSERRRSWLAKSVQDCGAHTLYHCWNLKLCQIPRHVACISAGTGRVGGDTAKIASTASPTAACTSATEARQATVGRSDQQEIRAGFLGLKRGNALVSCLAYHEHANGQARAWLFFARSLPAHERAAWFVLRPPLELGSSLHAAFSASGKFATLLRADDDARRKLAKGVLCGRPQISPENRPARGGQPSRLAALYCDRKWVLSRWKMLSQAVIGGFKTRLARKMAERGWVTGLQGVRPGSPGLNQHQMAFPRQEQKLAQGNRIRGCEGAIWDNLTRPLAVASLCPRFSCDKYFLRASDWLMAVQGVAVSTRCRNYSCALAPAALRGPVSYLHRVETQPYRDDGRRFVSRSLLKITRQASKPSQSYCHVLDPEYPSKVP